jgi:cysteine-rich repeat protein
MCDHTEPASCCGNGEVEAGEACDDGNQSNTDGCLTTCQDATCGDGFVRTGVEECDQGAANSGAPNAACRPDCRRQRCGDGVLDDLRGEQCDDAGTTPGDGCSAACFDEPPVTARLIPGKGNTTTDCALEWKMVDPLLDKKGIPDAKQVCIDGDPRCDMGTAAGECLFQIWLCANNSDPQLPVCSPGGAFLGSVAGVTLKKPSSRDAKPGDVTNRQQLLASANGVSGVGPGVCGPRMLLRVPRKSLTAKGTKNVRLQGLTDRGQRDSDVLKLFCLP